MSSGHHWSRLPSRQEILLALASFHRRQKMILAGLALILITALLLTVGELNRRFTTPVSASGGQITEGIIGTPRFINPLLAASDADRDLTTLIYSGLIRIGEDGQPEPDLAATYEVSEDGLVYTFTLREDLSWQDGEPITSADVEFTVLKAQDPLIKSLRRAGWEGVKVRVIDERTVAFDLQQPYPAFLENATLGILPKHLWEKFDPETFSLNQFNSEGIGSGPYRIKTIKKNKLGIPEYYTLTPFADFALGEPKISQVNIRFYANQEALLTAYRRGEIDGFAAVPAETAQGFAASGKKVLTAPLPRVFGVFFNQNQAPVLTSKEVREALDLAIDKQIIIDTVLHGYGAVARGPIPLSDPTETATSTGANLEAARAALAHDKWLWDEKDLLWKKGKNDLVLALATADTPELKEAAELIKQDWEKLGVKVELKIFELGDLNQNVIRPREYDAVFFGEILGRNPDPFAFWHSKQRLDPGLNIALYTNAKADTLLEKIRATTNREQLSALYRDFNTLILTDTPASFIYSPYFLYLAPPTVRDLTLVPINTAADRFLNIHRWYIKTDRVWSIFANQNNQLTD